MAVFDNLNTTYASGVAPEVTKYFDRVLLRETEAALVHQRDLQNRNLPLKNGKTIQFRKFHPFEPDDTPLKEGVTPDGQTLKVSEIHATVKPYGKHVEYTDELDLTLIDDNVKEAAQLLARQAAETLDMIAANALDLGSCYINQLKWLNEEEKLLSLERELGLEEGERVYGALALGWPAAGSPAREPLPRKGNKVTWIG